MVEMLPESVDCDEGRISKRQKPTAATNYSTPNRSTVINGGFEFGNDSGANHDTVASVGSRTEENQYSDKEMAMDSANENDYKCGYGRFTPKFLQKCHNTKCLVFVLCLCAITQGFVVNGMIPVSISTLEKRFHLSSTETGIFAGMYDIAVLLVLVPLSYFGGKGHKGRYLGIGTIVMGIGSFICALPQFTTGPYDYGQSSLRDTCQVGNSINATISCTELPGGNSWVFDRLRLYFYVLLLGQLFHGIGASPLYTLGITYIDENTSQRSSPFYLGIYIGFSTVGPALGFIVGGMLLRIYGDVGKIDLNSVHLALDDPRWYGAWWVGFIIAAALALIFSLPMLSFARELPEAKEHRLRDIDQTNHRSSTEGVFATQAFNNGFHETWVSFLQLLKNPTFTCLMIMQCAETFLLNGFVTFVPKLVENLFSMSSSNASMITGAIVVPCGFAGNLLGGYLIRRFKMLCRSVILLAFAFQACSILLVFYLFVRCPQTSFIGISEPYVHGQPFPSAQLADTCNAHCECDGYYRPVCNMRENVNYFSACIAGCGSKLADTGRKKQWGDCACLHLRINTTSASSSQLNASSTPLDTVQEGVCPSDCNLLPLFFVLFAILVLLTFSSAMPIQQAELRCVPFRLRTMAVGLRWIFARLLGAIPGTIAFGAAIDTTCIFWDQKCGEKASCLQYDSGRMAAAIMGFGFSLKAIEVISLFFAWKLYSAPRNETNDEFLADKDQVVHSKNKVAPVPGAH